MDIALDIKNLSYLFPDGTGVTDISFQIKRGDVYVLYGGHNSGKTVLLQTLIGSISPQSGTVKLFGSPNYLLEKRRIGFVPQSPYSVGKMTISELLRYFSLSFGVLNDITEKILGLNYKEKNPVCRLPLFTQRMVNLNIALLGKPDLVLMDDPFRGLDSKESEQLLSAISFLNKSENVTFLLTGQSYNLTSRIATRYGVLSGGNLLAELTPAKINEECERCIKIRTTQSDKAATVLQKEYPQYEILSDGVIRVFCPVIHSSKINLLLVSAGIEVSEIWIAGIVPQEYLSKLAGGDMADDKHNTR